MKSGTERVLDAIDAGRKTVKDISVHAHLSEADTRTYLGRLRNRGEVEKVPAQYKRKEPNA